MKTKVLKIHSIFAVIALLMGAQSYAQVQSEAYTTLAVTCKPVTVVAEGSTGEMGFSIFSPMNWNGTGATGAAAMITSFDSETDMTDINNVVMSLVTGSLKEESPNKGSFFSESKDLRLTIDILNASSHLKLEQHLPDGSWKAVYDDAAQCAFIQYESIGAHN